MTTRSEIMQRIATARTLGEQISLVAQLDALDEQARQTRIAEASLDWADTTVRRTLAPARTFDRHTAASDWLAETETSGGTPHHAVIAEASVWWQRLDGDVKADAAEFAEQARGMARRTAGRYGERAEEAEADFLSYVAFLNREVLAASGLPQVQQLVDAQESPAQTPLPPDVFDTFAPPVHPLNEGVDGQQTNSLAPGAEEAMSQGGGAVGRPSEHEEGQDPVSEPYYLPSSAKEGTRKQAGFLEKARHLAAGQGHAMNWQKVAGNDAYTGRCTGCSAAMTVTAAGIVQGSTAHAQACNRRAQASLAAPSVAIGYTYSLDDFLRAEAAREAGGAAPFVRSARVDPDHDGDNDATPAGDTDHDYWTKDGQQIRPLPKQGASGLDQVQQTTAPDGETARPTSLPLDVMFPIVQPWPEQDAGTGQPSRHEGVRKQADTWHGGDSPHAAPGTETPVANSAATTPPRATSGDFAKGMSEGQADAAAGEAPSFADSSSAVSDYVRGYVEGYGGAVPASGPRDVPGSMGGDSGQAANFARIEQQREKPLIMASKRGLTLSASLLSKDVGQDADFQRGYRYAARWRPGTELVAVGSTAEEAGIYAGITDNPRAQRAWVAAHRRAVQEFPELKDRMANHKRLTAGLARREGVRRVGLYVQAATSLDLDTMSPVTSPDPQGATPSEGPGTIPPLRDAPGTPAAPGGPSPYNGAEPYGAPAVESPMQILPNEGGGCQCQPTCQCGNGICRCAQGCQCSGAGPVAQVSVSGDSSLLSKNPAAVAFRRRVQATKLALRQQKEN